MGHLDELSEPDHVRTSLPAAWRPGVARVEAARAAVADDVDLAVECHGRMETSEAIVGGGVPSLLTRPMVHVIMPDVKHVGGLLETHPIAPAARTGQLLVPPTIPPGLWRR